METIRMGFRNAVTQDQGDVTWVTGEPLNVDEIARLLLRNPGFIRSVGEAVGVDFDAAAFTQLSEKELGTIIESLKDPES